MHFIIVNQKTHSVQRHLHRGVRAVELGHRSLSGERQPSAAQPSRVVRDQARRLESGRHLREREVIALLMSTLPHQRARLVDGRLRDAKRLTRDPDPPGVEGPHRDHEALPLAAETVGRRDANVLEHELAGRRAVQAHLLEDLADFDSGRLRRDQERGDAGGLLIRSGPREDHIDAGLADVGDEDLGAVEHVAVAVAPRGRLE